MRAVQVVLYIYLPLLFCACNEHKYAVSPIRKYAIKSDPPSGNTDSINNADSADVQHIVAGIEKSNRIESEGLGAEGAPSLQWERYERLKRHAATEQLIELTNHKSPVVRCYAFQALAARHSDKVFSILLDHLQDTAKVDEQSGCKITSQSTLDYFIDVVTTDRVESGLYRLNHKQRTILDSVLLNNISIHLAAPDEML